MIVACRSSARDATRILFCLAAVLNVVTVTSEKISDGKCVNISSAETLTDVATVRNASSARMCHYWCTQQDRPFFSWSYRDRSCNVSFSRNIQLYVQSDCVFYIHSRLDELQVFGYWPLSNHSRERNYGSAGAAFDAVKMGNVTYESDSAHMDGSTPGEQGFNISQISSLSLTEFTFAVWVNHANALMPIFESVPAGQTGYLTHVWLSTRVVLRSVFKSSGAIDLTSDTSSGMVDPNTWNFIAVTVNTTRREMFLNGNFINTFVTDTRSEVGSGLVNMADQVYLATTTNARVHPYQFIGRMKCAMFSSQVLSGPELNETMTYCQ